jgi:hypothetical protein
MSASDTPLISLRELAKLREELTAANARIKEMTEIGIDFQNDRISELEAKLDEQAVRLREAERDAERYRWLRDVATPSVIEEMIYVDPARTDAEIDTAREA